MGIQTMTIKKGGTMSVTGGTDQVFASDGQTVQNGVHLVVPATADYRVREHAVAKYQPPVLSPQGAYSRDRKSFTYTVPFITAKGEVVNNVIRVERQVHPELSAAAAADLCAIGAQLLTDSEAALFWSAGSTL